MKVNNTKVASLNVKIKNFFFRFVEFLTPFHKLSNQQQKVLASLLYYHYKLKQETTNTKILWKEVFDYDTKLLISEETGIKQKALENILSQLRKRKVIINNEIASVYIPEISKNSNKFIITFNFNILYE